GDHHHRARSPAPGRGHRARWGSTSGRVACAASLYCAGAILRGLSGARQRAGPRSAAWPLEGHPHALSRYAVAMAEHISIEGRVIRMADHGPEETGTPIQIL